MVHSVSMLVSKKHLFSNDLLRGLVFYQNAIDLLNNLLLLADSWLGNRIQYP